MARGRQAKSMSDVRSAFCRVVNRLQIPGEVTLLESPDGNVCVIRPNPLGGGFEVVMGPMACSTLCDVCDGAVDLCKLATVSFGLPQS